VTVYESFCFVSLDLAWVLWVAPEITPPNDRPIYFVQLTKIAKYLSGRQNRMSVRENKREAQFGGPVTMILRLQLPHWGTAAVHCSR